MCFDKELKIKELEIQIESLKEDLEVINAFKESFKAAFLRECEITKKYTEMYGRIEI